MELETNESNVSCPKCGTSQLFTPVSVIRDDGPELGLLYEGKLNRQHCEGCNTEFVIDSPIVYRDNNSPYLVYYLPLPNQTDIDEAISTVEGLFLRIFEEVAESDRPSGRLAITRRDFIEKIALHRSGYDDRLIEYVKYQLFQHSKGLDAHGMDLLFDFGGSTPDNIQFLAFNRDSGEPAYALGFPIADYNKLKEYFLDESDMETRLNNMFRRYYVHVTDLL